MWDIAFPPYNIALLLAILKKHQYHTDCFDLNTFFYKRKPGDSSRWHLENPYAYWLGEHNIDKLLQKWESDISQWIETFRSYGIIGFTIQSLNYYFSIKFAEKIKKRYPDKIIIFGGPECFKNFNADHLIRFDFIQAVCYGEGDKAFPDILDQIIHNRSITAKGFLIKNNKAQVIDTGNSELIKDLNKLPFADYSFLDAPETLALSTSRGCLYRCTFCHESRHWKKFRYRSAHSVLTEIKTHLAKFPDVKYIYFNDSLINGNIKELSKFCDLMIKEKIKINWGGHIAVREELTPDLLKKMKKAGADRLNFGIESGSDKVLKLMNKHCTRDLIKKVLYDTHKAGISFSVNIIIGFPGETEQDFNETRLLVKYIRKYTSVIHFNPCLVMKGAPLYMNNKKYHIVLPSDNPQQKWYLVDGTNTYDIRLKRLYQLQKILHFQKITAQIIYIFKKTVLKIFRIFK